MAGPTKVNGQVSFREVAKALLDDIRAGGVEPGTLLPTERELQARFGATRSTVRRALQEIVDTGWGEAIPNKGVAAAVPPASRVRTQNIGFVDHRSGFNRHLYVSLSVRLQAAGYHLVLVDSQDLGVEGAVEYAHSQGFAGVYVWSKTGYPEADRLRTSMAEMPVIALDHSLKTIPSDLVADDNFNGARIAIRHLAECGRKRIAITGFYDMSETNHDRFGGYLEGLFESGLSPVPRDFLFCNTSALQTADTLLLERRLADPDRPDAFFVLSDEDVPAVAEAIERAGLRIPQDVALVAFRNDVVPIFGETALTTVSVDWEAYAGICVDRMLQRLERPVLAPETFRLPTCLHIRGSCGAPRERWTEPPIVSLPGAFALSNR